MADITSEMVQKLRAKTGAGLMDCKRALVETAGDAAKAEVKLREQGAASAAKRAGKAAGDGLVAAHVDAAGRSAVLVELNCETDFVAGTDEFQGLLADLTLAAASAAKPWATPEEAPQARIKEMAAKLGENIQLRPGRFARFDKSGASVFGVYVHNTGKYKEGFGKSGVLLELSATDAAAGQADVRALAKDLAMQVAAAAPKWVRKEDVPADVIEQEKSIAREQSKRENKPEKIWDKIIQGKLQQFYKQFVLLEQDFLIGEGSGKSTVAQVLEQASKKLGAALAPKRFAHFKVGEE
jgi:elongation factor Ts